MDFECRIENMKKLFLYIFIGLILCNTGFARKTGCEGDCENGQGTYFVDVTHDYTGEFKNGKFNGLGVWSTIKDNGLFRASGTFKDNKPIDITWWKLLQIGLLEENHSWFYSGDSIEMKGDYLYVVDLDSYSSQSMTNQIQIDCKASKVRPIETAFYMDVMALGEPFQIVPNDQIPMPPEWLDIDSTPKTHLFRSLCEVYSEEIDETSNEDIDESTEESNNQTEENDDEI